MVQRLKGGVENESSIILIKNSKGRRLEILDEEAIAFSREHSMEDDEEDEVEGDSHTEGS